MLPTDFFFDFLWVIAEPSGHDLFRLLSVGDVLLGRSAVPHDRHRARDTPHHHDVSLRMHLQRHQPFFRRGKHCWESLKKYTWKTFRSGQTTIVVCEQMYVGNAASWTLNRISRHQLVGSGVKYSSVKNPVRKAHLEPCVKRCIVLTYTKRSP